jgi:dCMP deaminase
MTSNKFTDNIDDNLGHQYDILAQVEAVYNKKKRKQENIDHVRLKQCEAESSNSNCVKHSVGCIITDVDGRILSSGYNGTPAGHENCCNKFLNFDEQVATIKKEILSVELIERDMFNRVDVLMLETAKRKLNALMNGHHEWSATHEIHAEVNALLNSDPILRKGGTLYVNLQPCENCAKMIAASGVKRVVFGKAYHRSDDEISKKLFADSGIEYIHYPDII